MSDHSSAAIFGTVFNYLSERPDKRAKALAARLWFSARDYDFGPSQMDEDKALVRPGLAKAFKCGCVVYRGEKHEREYCEGTP